MKKHTYLGVSESHRSCCLLYSLLPFDSLVPDELERSDFIHRSTNWGGGDDIDRTLKFEKKIPTIRKIVLKKPLVFDGKDYDWGHYYPWSFSVHEIWELKDSTDEIESDFFNGKYL